jgi:predicted RNase H-like nuclease (RuvC/YqgF family)
VEAYTEMHKRSIQSSEELKVKYEQKLEDNKVRTVTRSYRGGRGGWTTTRYKQHPTVSTVTVYSERLG